MANAVRKWIPGVLIALATAASVGLSGRLPRLVELRFDDLLPFAEAGPVEPMARPGVLFLMPALAFVLWVAFRAAPTIVGQRVGRRMYARAPEAVTSPEQFGRFRTSYDTIVLGVVVLCLGLHAAF
jgi:hypothetical protein